VSRIPTDIGRSWNHHIKDMCPFSIAQDDAQNHCAHYVSHIMGYEFGATCKNSTLADKKQIPRGATLRVNDIFNNSPRTGPLASNPANLHECLIFVTLPFNVRAIGGGRFEMGEHPQKHVGILAHNFVWNYSNTGEKVVHDLPSVFQQKFRGAYSQNAVFYFGEFLR